MGKTIQREAARVSARHSRQQRSRVLAVLACIVVLATAFACMLPAISATRDNMVGTSEERNAIQTGIVAGQSDAFVAGQTFKGELKDGKGNVTLTVTVNAPEGAFPENTSMTVSKIANGDVREQVEAAIASAEVEGAITSMTAVDISFKDADGNAIEPAEPVEVKITSDEVRELENPVLVHVANGESPDAAGESSDDESARRAENAEVVQNVEVVSADESNGALGVEDTLKFTTDAFSPYVIVGTTIEKNVLSSDGQNYHITVTYGADSGIPNDAELEVSEIIEGLSAHGMSYEEYVASTENALGMEEGTAEYIRLFDISIVDKHDHSVKYQPAEGSIVDVRIELPDAAEKNALSVVHFADETADGNAVESSTESAEDGAVVEFAADGFSVYAVVDDAIVAPESRMTLYFHDVAGKIISTLYVKNSDTADTLEQIIYDPGDGHQAGNQLFKGWIIGKEGVSTVPDYDTSDADNALDIEDIRQWAEAVEITDGDEYHIHPMVFQTYAVTFKDEDGVTIHSAALIFKAGSHADYTINQPYTPKLQDEAFQGWYWTSPDGTVIAKDGSEAPFANGTKVEITGNVVFTVNVPKGYWLTFSENGSGASYTPPQFITTDSVTEQPANPTRLGYTFGGWYTNPECTGAQFTFGQRLTARTTLYAKWTPVSSAPYTVIIWKQNINGDGYDFEESIQLNGTPNTTINTVSQQGTGNNAYARINGQNKDYTGFHLKEFDQNVTITPEGNAVLNVYYDRTEYTLSFQVQGAYVETTGTNGTQYGYVDGEYIQLTRNGSAPNYTWTYGTGEYNDVYTATTSNNGTQYGIVNGEYVQLTRHGWNNNNYYWTYNDTWWGRRPTVYRYKIYADPNRNN